MFCVFWDYSSSDLKAKQYQPGTEELQNSTGKILANPGLAEHPGPGIRLTTQNKMKHNTINITISRG